MKIILSIGGNIINKGAEAMLMATVAGIRQHFPGYEPVLIDLFPSQTAESKGRFDFRIVNMHVRTLFRIAFPFLKLFFKTKPISDDEREIKNLFSTASAVFDISGYGLSSHNQSLMWSTAYLIPIHFARKNRIPVWLLPQSFGPFNFCGIKRILFKLWGKSLLNYPAIAFAREPEGLEALKYVRKKPNLLSMDIVLQSDWNVSSRPGKEVVVIPNRQLFNFSDPDKVAGLFSDIISGFKRKGFQVRIIRHSRDDQELCKRIAEKVGYKSLIVDDSDHTVESLLELISHAYIVVSARYHGVIHALKSRKPVLIIGWAEKYRFLAKAFDIEETLIDLEKKNIDDIDVKSLVDNIISNKELLTGRISKMMEEIRKDSFWENIKLES
jgi:polysaccharide pyruvyl transferase WcaK-like protein